MNSNGHIVKLDVRNVKRITAAHINPDGTLVILGGKNAAGKSSVLDAIMYALAGQRAIPDEPLRRGADKGDVTLTLDDGVTIRRTFTAGGGGTLTIKTADGMSPKSAQAWLDAKIGSLSFDPAGFLRQKPAEQAATLRRLTGVDTSALDAERARVFDERAQINRDGAKAKGAAESMPSYPDAPAAEVSVSALVAEQRKRTEARGVLDEWRRDAATARREADICTRDADTDDKSATAIDVEIVRLRAKQTDLRANVTRLRGEAETLTRAADNTDAEIAAKSATLPDPAALDAQIAGAEATNAKVRANTAKHDALAKLDELRTQSQAKTDRLAAIDAERVALLAAAKFPVPGLSISAAGEVTFNDLPLVQASQAEQIGVAFGVAAALSPGLRIVLIRDGSLLDADRLRAISTAAEEHGCQVWIERVGDADEGAIVIEDGCVRGAPAE